MKNLFLFILLFSSVVVSAQSVQDALRLSMQSYFGTARTAGVGGAFGAMGADFGSIVYNPASLGSYRAGELSLSFSSNKTGTNAVMEGDNNKSFETFTKRKMKLENAGLVISSKPADSKWKVTNFAFGLTRTANFDQAVYYEGETKGSFTDRFLERANGNDLDNLDDFEAGLAFDVGAIYGPDNQLYYTSDYLKTPNNILRKNQSVQSSGGISEMLFAYGLNYDERFMFGMSIGVPFVNFNETKEYTEEAIDDNSVLKKLEYQENLSTSGLGINFKAGMVAKFSNLLRVGAAVHSPSFYTLQDDYYMEMKYEFNDGDGLVAYDKSSPDGYFKYKFASPWRFIGSIGSIISLGDVKGFLDFDAEYADYSSSAFNFSAYSTALGDQENERQQNGNIARELKPAMTYRFGGEFAYKKWRARLGYILPGSPYGRDEFSDVSPTYTWGLGYRSNSFYIDMAFVKITSGYGYSPYELVEYEKEQFVTVDKTASKLLFTIGRKF